MKPLVIIGVLLICTISGCYTPSFNDPRPPLINTNSFTNFVPPVVTTNGVTGN